MTNLTISNITDNCGTEFKQCELRSVKEGTEFRRKLNAKSSFTREHYNRKNAYGTQGPACFTCVDADEPWGGREVYLKPSTIVFVEANQ